ncbi:DUF6483 family protein [Paenibacillus nasutitermitis]|uniref:Uncharacterized protein n=1 Tax=Paenibacillus nasutitermitis TaxID=1652958 RepID=A0A917DXD7_9BACL|nr:DUF6483 family protein [Paenibacillus nasutitermitis]GGD75801.1 hypothetical protein GCM10010911_37260 [Paenibacillus nasutitermitis]
MFQRDYFMRMIEQMTEVVRQVAGLRREGKPEEALLIINDMLDKRFRLNGKLIRSMSESDLLRIMTTNGVVETANLHAIALLMKEEAEIYDEQELGERSYPVRLKALKLFLHLALLDSPPMPRKPSDEALELLGKLDAYELPEETKWLIFEWHDADHRYDQAENILYELLEDGALSQEEALSFYQRLLLLPDDLLESGGLPREEVLDGQRSIINREVGLGAE